MADPLTIGLIAGGTLLSAGGQLQAGKAAQQASNFNAAQLDRRATAEKATASRKSAEERRKGRLIESRALAVGAASGGGVPTDQIGLLAQEGEFRALSALFEGEEAAAGLQDQGKAERFEGRQRRVASRINAFGTLLKGGSSLAAKYGG